MRAGETVTVREGIGTGFGRAPQPELAHDIALKAAETDATKRALATFGNPFGLALYDRDQAQVTKARVKVATDNKRSLQPPDLVLTDGEGQEVRFSDHEAFVEATLRQIERLNSTDSLYAFWSRNSAAFGKLRIGTEHGDDSARKLADALKERARQVGQPQQSTSNGATDVASFCRRADDGVLSHSKRKAGPRSGASRFCCQSAVSDLRPPAGASASLTLCAAARDGDEGSDEFTVPVCNTHHDQLHRSGDERLWARHGFLDPLKYALGFGKRRAINAKDRPPAARNPRSGFRGRVQRAVLAEGAARRARSIYIRLRVLAMAKAKLFKLGGGQAVR